MTGGQQEGGADRPKETPLQREMRLHAEQLQALRERAAEEMEANAVALEAAAALLEKIATDAGAAALEARESADSTRAAAGAARRRANGAANTTRRVSAAGGGPVVGGAVKPKARRGIRSFVETDKHAAAGRTAAQNKNFYLQAKRGKRGRNRQRIEETLTYSPGEAPDMADLDIYAEWQWAVNVARGGTPFTKGILSGVRKNGDIDIARVSFQPNPKKMAATGMKWGMRRFNLGDVTVVDCDFTGIPKEHGIYDSLSGHGLYKGNTFKNLGGQGIQISYRDLPHAQYLADNLPFTGKATFILDDCHAVDCGLDASRSGFTWTFFDPGTTKFPGTVIVRNCTVVHAWPFSRTSGGQRVAPSHADAMRAPGGLVLTQIQHVNANAKTKPTETLVIDNCLFDLTLSGMPIASVRGVETILIEDSCFIARDHRNPHFDVDDLPDRPSGKVIIENCVSPEGAEVWLRIRQKRVVSMHCPGKRLEIDVATLEVKEVPMKDDPITRLISPLANRTVRPGIHKPFRGGNPDLGTVPFRYGPAPRNSGR